MTVTNLNVTKTILAQAKEEFDKEQNEKVVKMLKIKLKEKSAAELALKNIDREIEDLVQQMEQGDIQ